MGSRSFTFLSNRKLFVSIFFFFVLSNLSIAQSDEVNKPEDIINKLDSLIKINNLLEAKIKILEIIPINDNIEDSSYEFLTYLSFYIFGNLDSINISNEELNKLFTFEPEKLHGTEFKAKIFYHNCRILEKIQTENSPKDFDFAKSYYQNLQVAPEYDILKEYGLIADWYKNGIYFFQESSGTQFEDIEEKLIQHIFTTSNEEFDSVIKVFFINSAASFQQKKGNFDLAKKLFEKELEATLRNENQATKVLSQLVEISFLNNSLMPLSSFLSELLLKNDLSEFNRNEVRRFLSISLLRAGNYKNALSELEEVIRYDSLSKEFVSNWSNHNYVFRAFLKLKTTKTTTNINVFWFDFLKSINYLKWEIATFGFNDKVTDFFFNDGYVYYRNLWSIYYEDFFLKSPINRQNESYYNIKFALEELFTSEDELSKIRFAQRKDVSILKHKEIDALLEKTQNPEKFNTIYDNDILFRNQLRISEIYREIEEFDTALSILKPMRDYFGDNDSLVTIINDRILWHVNLEMPLVKKILMENISYMSSKYGLKSKTIIPYLDLLGRHYVVKEDLHSAHKYWSKAYELSKNSDIDQDIFNQSASFAFGCGMYNAEVTSNKKLAIYYFLEFLRIKSLLKETPLDGFSEEIYSLIYSEDYFDELAAENYVKGYLLKNIEKLNQLQKSIFFQ
jgi:hypothetical protein